MMRPLSCLLLALLLLPSGAAAVSLEEIGLKAGLGLNQADFQYEGQKLFDADAVYGPALGIYGEWDLGRASGLRLVTELLYVGKGFEGDDAGRAVDAAATYLSVPVLLKPTLGDDLKLYVFFGPSLEILLDNDDEAVFDDYKSLGVAANIGFGLDIELVAVRTFFEARFVADLTDASDAGDPLNSVKYRGVMAMIGVGF